MQEIIDVDILFKLFHSKYWSQLFEESNFMNSQSPVKVLQQCNISYKSDVFESNSKL